PLVPPPRPHPPFPIPVAPAPPLLPSSLHDALPIARSSSPGPTCPRRTSTTTSTPSCGPRPCSATRTTPDPPRGSSLPSPLLSAADRKSTRLNSSHVSTSYAGFCLTNTTTRTQRTRP